MSLRFLEAIAIQIGFWLLANQGLSLLTGFTGLFSFGHAGFLIIGSYTTAMLTTLVGVPFYLALVCAGLMAALISWLLGMVTLKLKGDYFVIMTLGFGESIRLLFNWMNFTGGARGFTLAPGSHQTSLIDVIIINIIGLYIMTRIINSRHGRNLQAIREEEMASNVIGINVFKYKTLAFVLSAFYAGVAGGLYAHYYLFITPQQLDLFRSTILTIMVILGGLGSMTGTVVGTIVLVSLPEVLRDFGQWRWVVFGALVVLIMVFRPKGLMGGHEFSDLWKRKKVSKTEGDVK